MKKYIVALICCIIAFIVLGAAGYFIYDTQPSAPDPAESNDLRVAVFIFGALAWSGMLILAVLSLIGVNVFPFIKTKRD